MSAERIEVWFNEWRKPVRNWLQRRLGYDNREVDDLAQEVFERLLRYDKDAEIDNPRGYIFQTAANVFSEWRERCRIRLSHSDDELDELICSQSTQAEEEIQQAQLDALVRDAVSRLTPRQEDLILLHTVQGFTYKQIAIKRGLTYRIVLRELSLAYSGLRTYFSHNPAVMEIFNSRR